jgi:hypothetical protein
MLGLSTGQTTRISSSGRRVLEDTCPQHRPSARAISSPPLDGISCVSRARSTRSRSGLNGMSRRAGIPGRLPPRSDRGALRVLVASPPGDTPFAAGLDCGHPGEPRSLRRLSASAPQSPCRSARQPFAKETCTNRPLSSLRLRWSAAGSLAVLRGCHHLGAGRSSFSLPLGG